MPDGYPLSFVSLAGGSVAHQGSMMKCRVDPTFADRGVIFCTPKTIGGAITGGSTKKKNPALIGIFIIASYSIARTQSLLFEIAFCLNRG